MTADAADRRARVSGQTGGWNADAVPDEQVGSNCPEGWQSVRLSDWWRLLSRTLLSLFLRLSLRGLHHPGVFWQPSISPRRPMTVSLCLCVCVSVSVSLGAASVSQWSSLSCVSVSVCLRALPPCLSGQSVSLSLSVCLRALPPCLSGHLRVLPPCLCGHLCPVSLSLCVSGLCLHVSVVISVLW